MQQPVNRRDFLTRVSVLPVGAALTIGIASATRPVEAQTPIKRGGGPRLKTSLNAYSFSKALNDLLDFCAERNFDAIDPTGYFFPGYPKVPTDQYINSFKKRAFQLGLDISGTGVRNNFAAPDREARAADVRLVKEWIECAARMGAPVLRVFAGPMPEGYKWDQVSAWMVESLKECVEHGKQYGVLVGIQNHGDTLKTADDVLKIVKMVDSEWFGAIVDTGYFLSPDPYEDIARVVPHAVNWQVKENVDGAAGHSRTDMKRLVKIARDGGYRGYLPIETLSAKGGTETYDPRARVSALLKELREAIEQTA
jgi:sugar phosphate isomerase/epimerase